MPESTAKVSLDEMTEHLRQLIKQEDETLWAQGDYLVEVHPTDDEFRKLAELLNRKQATLRIRQRVANEFPKATRGPVGTFTVYVELLKVPDPEARQAILRKRPVEEWTVTAMMGEVLAYLKSTGATRLAKEARRAGLRIGEYRVIAELSQFGLELTVTPYDGHADPVIVKAPAKLLINVPDGE